MKKSIFILIIGFFVSMGIMAQEKDFPKLTGPYLGQKVPGMTPEIFAPGIVSTEKFIEFKGAFSTDGREYYFYKHALPEYAPTLFFTKVENGVWTEPVELPVARGVRTSHPCISHDNRWLFFKWSFKGDQNRQSGYYACKRTDTGWSTPVYAGQGMYLTSDKSGNLYTTEAVWGEQPKFYLSKMRFDNGVFGQYDRQKINPHFGNQTHPCIAPDGSYIIFDINVENSSLYVSFKDPEGQWGEAIDLTRYGIQPNARGAYVSPDGRYLFYSCHEGDIWWVDARIIEMHRSNIIQPDTSNTGSQSP